MLLVFVGPCLTIQIPREVGRWELAAALNARDAGRKDEAYALLQSAQKWIPVNSTILLQLAEWKLEDGDKSGALQDCDKILDLREDEVELLRKHSQFLQNVGQRVEAIKDWKRLNQLSERSGKPSRREALNGLAYAQAVAGIERNEALDYVNEALELAPGDPSILDTRGYLLHQVGQDEAALDDMNRAVKEFESSYGRIIKRATEPNVFHDKFLNSEPRVVREVGSLTNPSRADLARGIAVVRYHRALVLQALGRDKEAAEDLARVRQLVGREGDETLF